jgi:hypothetical protein
MPSVYAWVCTAIFFMTFIMTLLDRKPQNCARARIVLRAHVLLYYAREDDCNLTIIHATLAIKTTKPCNVINWSHKAATKPVSPAGCRILKQTPNSVVFRRLDWCSLREGKLFICNSPAARRLDWCSIELKWLAHGKTKSRLCYRSDNHPN